MKKIFAALCLCLALAAPAAASPLSDKMLELFKDKNPDVSLGAMLIAPPVGDNAELIKYVRWSLKRGESATARLVKLYYLASTGFGSEDALAFVKEFPEDPEKFNAVLAFDSSLTRTVSGVMVEYLVSLTECNNNQDVRAEARDKVERLRMVQLISGWSAEIFPDGDFPACRNR